MKLPSTQSITKGQFSNLTGLGFTSFAALLTIVCANVSYGSAVDIGAAAGYSVLTYNSNNSSDSAYQGATQIGVVNGNWTQSGGGQTNTQQPTTVILSPGHTNNGPAIENTVFNAAQLNAAWSAAQNASASFATLAATPSLAGITSITAGQTITETAVGNYVLNLSSINLNQSALTLSAPAGSTFVINISGNITLAGGSQGNGLLVAGGLNVTNVIYNLTGANSSLTTSGGGNAQMIDGIVLATGAGASVNLHPGGVDGEVIATTFTSSSGALVFTPIPEVSTFLPLGLVMGLVLGVNVVRRRRSSGEKLA